MRQDELSPAPGARKDSKRVGRGYGSGHGVTAGRGQKGQKSRSGYHLPRGFEGGQQPLFKRLAGKRGFTSRSKSVYSVVNVGQLNQFEAGSEVTILELVTVGLVNTAAPVKILAEGELEHALTVKANRFSAAAKAKIEAAGGKIEEVGGAAEAE